MGKALLQKGETRVKKGTPEGGQKATPKKKRGGHPKSAKREKERVAIGGKIQRVQPQGKKVREGKPN